MEKMKSFPNYILESSWEVCNKVGGIYTVLSTRAKTVQSAIGDHLIFIGPDLKNNADFIEDNTLFADWRKVAIKEGLQLRVGRWDIPGRPIAVLVDFTPYFSKKDEIYAWLWEKYQVDSLHAYGDYDEASMFAYGTALVVESFYKHEVKPSSSVIYHANEWMLGLSLLYLKYHCPQIATIFTTHATTIGRSIAGNHKPLYDYMTAYNGDQMAQELNVESKHSIEKQTAWHADCFTTVSNITDRECKELLDKAADVVLPNGFEDSFVPQGVALSAKSKKAKKQLLDVANKLTGADFALDKTLVVSTSGRYEFRNKGIDVFIDAINRLRFDNEAKKKVVAFINVPAWVGEPRADLQERCQAKKFFDTPLSEPFSTHWLHNWNEDQVLSMLRAFHIDNNKDGNVFIIFVPCYLNGHDGIFNLPYYDLVLGNDLCIYPSYYEPWGYTPLEAVAFGVPCITTNLAGFGQWALDVFADSGKENDVKNGVKVVHRTDNNYHEVANEIKDTIAKYAAYDEEQIKDAKKNARQLSKKALWSEFIQYYIDAYNFALEQQKQRLK
ncbi:MAG: glycogen/starch synthase [Prevotellaceae bacterium]|nr:glycogen/starch synthase [Prevotellaceae bacterium]MDY3365425.1 glycogen/starch synthase [Prevotella sp.]